MSDAIVSVTELSERLGRRGLAVIDCRFDLAVPERGESEYLVAHIPGAVYAHLERDLSAPKTGTNGRHPLPTVKVASERFGAWGIDADVEVVTYDSGPGAFASRLWWMLRYLGHDRVSVLDGGFQAWRDASLPVRTGREERKSRRFEPHPRPEMHVELAELLDARTHRDRLLVDARDPARFRGDQEPIDPVAGHIPGARNHFWQDNLAEQGHFLPPARLRERLTSLLDGTPPEKTVVYCGSGVTACHDLLALEIAGMPGARLYAGSWSEWCADPSRPVETGESRG